MIAVFSFYQETSTSPILSGEEIQQKGKKRKHNEEETIQKIVEGTKQSRLETVMVRCSLKCYCGFVYVNLQLTKFDMFVDPFQNYVR